MARAKTNAMLERIRGFVCLWFFISYLFSFLFCWFDTTSAPFPRFRSKRNPSIQWRQRTALTANAGRNVRLICRLRRFHPC